MTEMIERVKAALIAAINVEEVYVRDNGDDVTIDGRVKMETLARAAIEAMREPTEKMRDRYYDDKIVGYGPDGSDHDLVWKAGIDAALGVESPRC